MRTLLPLALVAILASPTPAHAANGGASGLWETWYSVSARVRTKRIDADLEAGGRLAMAGLESPAGGLSLSLSEVLEHPWKLYWVDPLGPVGEEIKVASVVTLREASWDALAAAEAENKISAAERHRKWSAAAQRPRELDGSFAFVVVGDARNGFRIEITPKGRVAHVVNRLTDRWLFGPFDQFVGKPAPEDSEERRAAPAPVGYWFWNHGEEEPHGYEPHTYHAFAAALALLSLELPPVSQPGVSAEEAVTWWRYEQRVIRVLSILAPRIDASSFPGTLPAQTRMRVTREALPTGASRLVLTSAAGPSQAEPSDRPGRSPADAGRLTAEVERQTVFSSEGRPVSDWTRVKIAAIGGGSLEVEVGYRPWDAQEESK